MTYHDWYAPCTCCPGSQLPVWWQSSRSARCQFGEGRGGWPRGSHSHTWERGAPLSWWGGGSGRTLWWSWARRTPMEEHTGHAQYHSLGNRAHVQWDSGEMGPLSSSSWWPLQGSNKVEWADHLREEKANILSQESLVKPCYPASEP